MDHRGPSDHAARVVVPSVRTATEADGTTLAEILIEAFLAYHTPFIPEPVERVFVESYTHNLIAGAWQHMLLAEDQGRAIAMLYRDGGRIEALNARPGHRGRGAGGALLMAGEAAMRAEARAEALVDTYEANKEARGFYQRFGYRVVRRWLQTAFTAAPIPMVTMAKSLD